MTVPIEIEVTVNAGQNGSVILSFPKTDIPSTTVGKVSNVDRLIESVEVYFLWVTNHHNVHPYYDRAKLRKAWQIANIPVRPPEITYEYVDVWKNVSVDLTEALVGWKCWSINIDRLETQGGTIWYPDTRLEAVCTLNHTFDRRHDAPNPGCNCGIHGATDRATAQGYGKLIGEVYGWGRYCRHEHGWRSQFAYPKSFLLESDQVDLIEHLKAYHVPIFIMQPTLIYNPEEDGYEYRTTETYWSSGTSQDTTSGEDTEADEDPDYD